MGNDNENTIIQNPGDAAKAVQRRNFYINTILSQEIRKISSNLNLYPKHLEKKEQIKPKFSRRTEIIKSRA